GAACGPSPACAEFLRRRPWPSPTRDGSALPTLPPSASGRGVFRGFLVRSFATTCRVARPSGGSNRGASEGGYPLSFTLPGRSPSLSPQPTGTFTSGLSTGRSPFPPPDMTTVSTGQSPPAGLSPARTSASIAATLVQTPWGAKASVGEFLRAARRISGVVDQSEFL